MPHEPRPVLARRSTPGRSSSTSAFSRSLRIYKPRSLEKYLYGALHGAPGHTSPNTKPAVCLVVEYIVPGLFVPRCQPVELSIFWQQSFTTRPGNILCESVRLNGDLANSSRSSNAPNSAGHQVSDCRVANLHLSDTCVIRRYFWSATGAKIGFHSYTLSKPREVSFDHHAVMWTKLAQKPTNLASESSFDSYEAQRDTPPGRNMVPRLN